MYPAKEISFHNERAHHLFNREKLLSVQARKNSGQAFCAPPPFIRLAEKIFGRNRKICANRKEALQRRKSLSVFNQVDVVHVLTECDAHLARRNSLAIPQESKPLAKVIFIFTWRVFVNIHLIFFAIFFTTILRKFFLFRSEHGKQA